MAAIYQPARALPITPSDSAGLSFNTQFVSFTNSGIQTLTVDMAGGDKNVSLTLPSGMYQLCVSKVYATGTSVTNIVGYFN